MSRSALPRVRPRLLVLQAAANDAADALEAFEGTDAPEDRERWQGAVARFQAAQQGAAVAAKEQEEAPHKRRAAQAAKAREEKARKKIGTRVRANRDASEVQRIVQCECGASMQLWLPSSGGSGGAGAIEAPKAPKTKKSEQQDAIERGLAAVRKAGWRSRWQAPRSPTASRLMPVPETPEAPNWQTTDGRQVAMSFEPLVRVWFCPECWVPPVFVEKPRVFKVPDSVLDLARMRADSEKRHRLVTDMKQLVTIDPEMGTAWLGLIVEAMGDTAAGEAWKKVLEAVTKTEGTAP